MIRMMMMIGLVVCLLTSGLQAQTHTLTQVNDKLATLEVRVADEITLAIQAEANSANAYLSTLKANAIAERNAAIARMQGAPNHFTLEEALEALAAGDALQATADWHDTCGDDYNASGVSNKADVSWAMSDAIIERNYQTAHNAQYDAAYELLLDADELVDESIDDFETADDYYSGASYYYMQAADYYGFLYM